MAADSIILAVISGVVVPIVTLGIWYIRRIIVQHENYINEIRADNVVLRRSVISLEADKIELAANYEGLRQIQRVQNERLALLQSELDLTRRKYAELESKYEELAGRYEIQTTALVNETEAKKTALRQLEQKQAELIELNRRLSLLDNQVVTLKASLEKVERDYEAERNARLAAESETAALRKDLAERSGELTGLREEFDRAKIEISALKTELETLRDQPKETSIQGENTNDPA